LADLLFCIDQGLGQGLDFAFRSFDQMHGEALGALGANARQALELFNEAGEGTGINGRSPPNDGIKKRGRRKSGNRL
jgi:hypothetical protein